MCDHIHPSSPSSSFTPYPPPYLCFRHRAHGRGTLPVGPQPLPLVGVAFCAGVNPTILRPLPGPRLQAPLRIFSIVITRLPHYHLLLAPSDQDRWAVGGLTTTRVHPTRPRTAVRELPVGPLVPPSVRPGSRSHHRLTRQLVAPGLDCASVADRTAFSHSITASRISLLPFPSPNTSSCPRGMSSLLCPVRGLPHPRISEPAASELCPLGPVFLYIPRHTESQHPSLLAASPCCAAQHATACLDHVELWTDIQQTRPAAAGRNRRLL